MKKITYKMAVFFVGLLILTGCESWLDVKPEDRMTDRELFSYVQGFRTALNGIYVELNDRSLYGANLLATVVEVLAQRYDFSGTTTEVSKMGNYRYDTDYSKEQFAAIWEKAYAIIANCNKLLAYAEERNDVLTGANRELIMGETYALRAFLHFDLLRLFGPVYSVNKTAESIPYNIRYSISAGSLLPAEQVMEKVLGDLKLAEELLKKSDPIIELGPQNEETEDGLNTTTYRTQRFNYYAVKALQARANLYAGNAEAAVEAARAVVAVQEKWFPFTKRSAVMGTKNADRIFSSEILFSLYNTSRSEIFNDYFGPAIEPSKVYLPKQHLDEFFSQDKDNDWRYSSTWLTNSERGEYKCFHKYESVTTQTNINYLIPLIRITEMFYIIAEASTDRTEALNAINKVMDNRGLSYVSEAQIATTLREEYKREFWGEGQLFFYYKRLNEPSIHSFSENSDIDMDETTYVIPLPLSETDFR